MSTNNIDIGHSFNVYDKNGTRIGCFPVTRVAKTFVVVDGVKYRRESVRGREVKHRNKWIWVDQHPELSAMDNSGQFLRCALTDGKRELVREFWDLRHSIGELSYEDLSHVVTMIREMMSDKPV